MPVLKRLRAPREMDPGQVGVIGFAVIALILLAAFNVGHIQRAMAGPLYEADFAHAGGLRSGDQVRVSGVAVGQVHEVLIEGNHVRVMFEANGVVLGDRTEASIKTASVVGGRYLALSPGGLGQLDRIPLDRTQVPYDLTSALGDLTETAAELDMEQIAAAMNAVSEALEGTPDSFGDVLSGVHRLSNVVVERDEALEQLLLDASSVSGVLASRSEQLTSLMGEGNKVLAELVARREVIRQLLVSTRDISEQLSGVVADNREQLRPALDELDRVITVLRNNEESITFLIDHMGGYTRNLGEAVGGGPFFYGYVHNLVPTNLVPLPIQAQPEVDGTD